MKKTVLVLSFLVFFMSNLWATDIQNKESTTSNENCEKVCKKWEERRFCQPDPVFPGKKICGVYKVCVEWEEVCN
ncbi:hypothetical protein F1847_07030 [Thermodesulfobacterium sp. TA1]|uniref:hypothetical protein n=1 Tax=Thermodesulfobacterium sp. TA1 TaxID=2234087 RepID=UPI0012320859|nr:hypothetical protein [Thermodesulfobacterium sp. TA1]QER42509.1 hypothetical protein F1847_07030 [Thermodesulfobacterium sp. TA1]